LFHSHDGSTSENLTTTVDIVNNIICGETTQFSEFGLAVLPTEPNVAPPSSSSGAGLNITSGGSGGGGIFGDIVKSTVIGYHLDGLTTEGVQIYMPVTKGFKALKGAQEYVNSFAPNLASFIRECFDQLEQRADADKAGFLYQFGTHVFPVLGRVAEWGLKLIGEDEYIKNAYCTTTISVDNYRELEGKGLAIAPKVVKDFQNQEEVLNDLVY